MDANRVKPDWKKLNPPTDVAEILTACPSLFIPSSLDELFEAAAGGPDSNFMEVGYEVPEKGFVKEAEIARVRNGVSANYVEPYMRRRDPDCMLIADGLPTDKERYRDRLGKEFGPLRQETFEWLKEQDLACFGFQTGRGQMGVDALVIAPANAAFFGLGLAMLQGVVPLHEIREDFEPKLIIYTAPPFRHTHFDGKQMVVHDRSNGIHEMFSFNLYPGPSAKKGVYGSLILQGEQEGWVTAHCSTVQVITPYDNAVTIMHEGASGGGKSEMLEQAHRESDGRLLLGRNIQSGERRFLEIPRLCQLRPVTDDMALCHPSLQQQNRQKLSVADAEDSWFVRVNHITGYATDPHLEKLTAEPAEPLLFLNIDAVPRSRALIWEHIQDAPGVSCPNPRVIVPRRIVPGIVDGAVTVDIRSLGVRTPPCTREHPTFGILGIFHVLPPALAWLWRLVAPRGHANPSIVEKEGMGSEGVGSYWPFATGRRVDQANLLLQQIEATLRTNYILCPNQNIGAWETGFMPQWIAREYLSRRGSAKFNSEQVTPSRCPLLGYSMHTLTVEGRMIPRWFLQVNTQPEVGDEAFDAGADQLYAFFHKHLASFEDPDLHPLGKKIIDCCFSKGTVTDYESLLPVE